MGKTLTYMARAAAIIADADNAVGRIKKGYGSTVEQGDGRRSGDLWVTLFDTFPETWNTAEPLWVEIDSLAVPLFVSAIERKGAGSAVVRFDDFEWEVQAAMLVGKVLYREGNPAEEGEDEDGDDFEAWCGFELTDRASGRIGRVAAFYDYPGNPLLGVDFDGQEVMVPVADEVIVAVNERKKRLEAVLPEGLFEL